MKNVILALVAVVIGSIFCADANAALFGRRRGGGGNMGAVAGNGLCNMAKQSSVRPSQVIGGDFGIKPEPAAPVAPDDRITVRESAAAKLTGRPARVDFNVFDAAPSTQRQIVRR